MKQALKGESMPSPEPGDVVCGCRHRPSPYAAHWYELRPAVDVTAKRPWGAPETLRVRRVILCGACQLLPGPATDKMAGHFVWKEGMDAPDIERPS